MARVLIIGCGCRGQQLARELGAQGHTIRGTTRTKAHYADVEAAGAEPVLANPDRVATLIPAFAGVTITIILLGSATGTQDHLTALHTTRLEMLLQRTIDTTIHGLIYEATGTIDQNLLDRGANLVQTKCDHDGIPHRILRANTDQWLTEAAQAVESLLTT
jgi:saccharopine dehydrogenase-like NADP-dependent oxidoreductase